MLAMETPARVVRALSAAEREAVARQLAYLPAKAAAYLKTE